MEKCNFGQKCTMGNYYFDVFPYQEILLLCYLLLIKHSEVIKQYASTIRRGRGHCLPKGLFYFIAS